MHIVKYMHPFFAVVNRRYMGGGMFLREEGGKMKRLIGYSLFCIGIGMFIMCFIESIFFKIILIGGCMLLGYFLFCC